MAYDERSFLNGLAAGLTATAGHSSGVVKQTRTTGTDRVLYYPPGEFDLYMSKVIIDAPYPTAILYEFGTDRQNLERVYRRVGASAQEQTFYHVVQLPEALPMNEYHYNVFLLERDDINALIRFDTMFMAFPYYTSTRSWIYPGRPELVHDWWTRTYR